MWLKMFVVFCKRLPKPILSSLGFAWLVIEVGDYFFKNNSTLPWWVFTSVVLGGTLGITIYDGLFGQGFLRKSVTISSNSFDTKIIVKFGNIFEEGGWKVIAVNDFFDSIVDGDHVSPNSLHGKMLLNCWDGNIADWEAQIENAIGNYPFDEVPRKTGKSKRYSLGTTARTRIKSDQFLCMALGVTNVDNLEVRTTSEELLLAIKKMLQKARSFCSGEILSIPVMGSGLSKTGVKFNILLHLILLAVFEETKQAKVTDTIQIVIFDGNYPDVNLLTLKEEWK